jgi:protein deglycase
LVAVADDSEEIETVTIIDTLRRANIEVKVSKVGEDKTLECTMSRGVKLVKSINFQTIDC